MGRDSEQAYRDWLADIRNHAAYIEGGSKESAMRHAFIAGWNDALQSVERRRTVRPKRAVQQAKTATCLWKYDADTCSYDTSCGQKFVFNEGTAYANGVRFCYRCGKRAAFR